MKNTDTCIIRTTFHDRASMLQLSLEYQKVAQLSDKFDTYIFVDPHPKYLFTSDYDKVITKNYIRKNWSTNQGKFCWYNAVKYIFDTTDIEYVISIEDDIIISTDYLRICKQIIQDKILKLYSDILYFHIGAWIEPFGNPNKIVRSSASSRSILIDRQKFELIKNWMTTNTNIIDNDHMMADILKHYSMTTIAPQMNRHGHFGIYGWSASGIFSHASSQKDVFNNELSFDELYNKLKHSCLNKEQLCLLNQNKNASYFWNFDPNIDFTKLEYNL